MSKINKDKSAIADPSIVIVASMMSPVQETAITDQVDQLKDKALVDKVWTKADLHHLLGSQPLLSDKSLPSWSPKSTRRTKGWERAKKELQLSWDWAV